MQDFYFGSGSRYRCIREFRKTSDPTLYWIVEDDQFAYEQKILKAIPLLSDEAHEEAEEEIKRLSNMKNDFFAKLLDDVRFTGPNNVEYRGLILEYLTGGDLGEFLANLQKNAVAPAIIPVKEDDAEEKKEDEKEDKEEKDEKEEEDDGGKEGEDDGEKDDEGKDDDAQEDAAEEGEEAAAEEGEEPGEEEEEDEEPTGLKLIANWSEDDALRLASQIVFAMDYLHGKKEKVHKELNPENILISADGKKIKILDLQIAGGNGGTTDYFYPPETLKSLDTDDVTFKRDTWSMGVIFHMLCTFVNPFVGAHKMETFNNIMQVEREEVPEEAMEELIKCCLVDELDDRVDSASALIDHESIKSLVSQLKSGVEPAELQFSLDEMETLEVVNNTLAEQNADLKRQLKARDHGTPTYGYGSFYDFDGERVRWDDGFSSGYVSNVLSAINSGMESANFKFTRHQEYGESYGDYYLNMNCFDSEKKEEWKLWLTKNGNPVPCRANADCMRRDGKILYSFKNIEPDEDGMLKCAEDEKDQKRRMKENPGDTNAEFFIRWNITILPQE
ncbi:Oidioi.mRNA.OKI2018_I69.chr1.g3720.t1.cds [Oikopleura dioica]|uniref:Oidioi.mRNA.OKI2018_I69.chr1.g3720.t1.cds n=1 Tax=Oikopleura dioica TaxID=34765 RepID=A0ABN7T1K1_OIKDI|nr:Oidioi.mRNA.OKI2018_I69.chr1.g3720.t1.cds [Oikopleura dioica]